MSTIKIELDGRTIAIQLPSAGDVAIDLREIKENMGVTTGGLKNKKIFRTANPDVKALKNAGPSSRKLYRWLVDNSKDGMANLDPVLIEAFTGLVPIALGRVLGSLERSELITVVHRKKDDAGRICSYKIEMNSVQSIAKGTDEGLDVFTRTVLDIQELCSLKTAILFTAFCKASDVDGKWVGVHLSEIETHMSEPFDYLPEEELDLLERGDWITVEYQENCLIIGIRSWELLKPYISR